MITSNKVLVCFQIIPLLVRELDLYVKLKSLCLQVYNFVNKDNEQVQS